jgi:hypothetical protein
MNMGVRIELDESTFQQLFDDALQKALARIEGERARFGGRLAYPEAEAAALLGVKPYVLRDCRRRGELEGAKVGSKIIYSRADLEAFLERQKEKC